MKFARPTAITAVLALLVAGFVGTSAAAPAYADSQLTQLQNFYAANDAGLGAVTLSQTDVSYLKAAQATLGGSGLSVSSSDAVHGNPVGGWSSTSQSMSWPVTNSTAGNFVINTLIANGSATIRVSDGSSSTSHTYSSTDGGWDKTNYGQIAVPSGTSTITIQATANPGTSMSLLSLELMPAGQVATLTAAYAAGRSQATWMKNDPIGVMYQWGQWGANEDGTEPAWPVVYQNANFTALAARDKAMGASYVVWSITWAQYYVAAPIGSVDSVLTGRTSSTDYLQSMLTAFHNAGLHVIFYYHDGHDSNPNPNWWNSFWGGVPAASYSAEKATAMNSWLNIITEIGNRYGTQLDGWLFDDGGTYYPMSGALVNSALRAGNANRMVSFNPNGNGPRLTDYEDFSFGEGNDGTGVGPVNADGQITAGGLTGEQGFGNITMDNGDWGVRTGDTTPITPARSQGNLTFVAENAALTHQSVAVDQRMWSDLTQSPDSVAELTAAAQTELAQNPVSMIDDPSAAISYSAGWQNSNPGGCFASTCHNANTTGATAQYTFTGSGITWNSITSWDQGKADVYIDGTFYQTVNPYTATRTVGVPVFTAGVPYGTHTIKIVSDNSSWLSLDSFAVNTGGAIDDGNAGVVYTGTWANSNPGGCLGNTCHNSQTTGSTAQTSFTGTGVTWNSIVGPGQGQADVYIDGTYKQTVNLYASSRSEAVPVYSIAALTNGSHTIKVVTDNTSWVSIDDFVVAVSNIVDDSSSGITYSGAWQNSNPGGCYNNTCHNVQSSGASAQDTFSGTGVTFNSIIGPDQGTADIYIDGVFDETVNLYNAARSVNVPVYSKYGLTPGSHTIKIVSDNSNWVTLDDFAVTS